MLPHMDPVKDHLDVLQNIETAVAAVWRKHPDLTNYAVARAYDAAITHYRAVERGQTPKPANVTGVDAEIFNAVQAASDLRLADPQEPISAEDLLACLRKLRKSVDFWTEQGGRQGYLKLIEKFVS
jgi:hypothetical protein